MAGRGPVPKHPDRRARQPRGARGRFRSLTAVAVGQPELPDIEGGWPEATRSWWANLATLPLAGELTQVEWDYLLDTALVHRAVWADGQLKLAGELRLRLAKFGLTAEDRARMQIELLPPEPDPEPTKKVTARGKYAGLRARTQNEVSEGIL